MRILPKWVGKWPVALAMTLTSVLMMVGCGGTSSTSNNVTATPSFSPGGGTYNASQTVTISDATSGAVLYCTTDGTTPTTSSAQCAQPTIVFKTEFLQAIAAAPGKTASAVVSAGYTIDLNAAATPSFSPAGGSYTSAQTVTISDATSGANIYYTTDGSTPTASSTLYTGPIPVSSSETLSAIATASGYSNSGVAIAAYTIVPPAAVPTFSPAGGSYTSAQTVTIADTTPGAVIYYTTDGTPATATSTRYSGPVAVTQSETVNAIAVAPGYSSTTASAIYSINLQQVLAPTFTLANNQLTISDATVGATIYYTTDGTQPSASSTLHGAAPLTITVTAGETVNAIAAATGYGTSPVATYTVSLSAASQPTFSLVNNQLTISDATAGTMIYYTTDGSQPSASSPLHGAAPLTITVTAGEAVNAIAVVTGYTNSAVATYAVTAAPTPSFSLANNQLTIGDTAAGATIYYTIDGTQPSASSPLHGAAPLTITVTAGEAVNAIAVVTGYTNSAVATYAVTAAPTPSFSLANNQLTIGDTAAGATIYYTIDGTQPSASSPLHGAAPVTITVTVGEAVNAIAVAANYVSSTVGAFTARAAQTPSFSLSGSQLTISDTTTGATIYYTTDGTQPTTSSPLSGSSPITITVTGGEVINAIAAAPNYLNSVAENYTVGVTGTPEFSLSGGNLTIDDATSGAVIYYTINGSAPTTSSPLHGNAPVTVAVSIGDVVQAIALAPGNTVSALASYTVKATAATPQITPNGGYVLSSQVPVSVSITEASSGATVYYTIDGTTPSATNGTSYSAAFTVSPTASSPTVTVKAIAVGSNYNDSAEADSTFTLLASPTVSGQVVSGSAPISGATVQLYAAGTTGYNSAPTALTVSGNLTTDANGKFALAYTCPAAPGDRLYLVASGGNAGQGTNSDIKLMTALGSCNSSSFPSTATVNEVTTIASAYALSAFAKVDANGGFDVGAPIKSGGTCDAKDGWLSFGKETCNYNGLSNAFAAANNLVNIATGAARIYTPDYPTNSAGDTNLVNNSNVPTARINALADMLAYCVESNGSGCSGSTNLFGAATPTSGTQPNDTLQAALNIAQNPGSNGISVSTLLGLVPTTNQPYATDLGTSETTPPQDLTLAITFTGGGFGLPPAGVSNYKHTYTSSMAIDVTGNIWVAGYAYTSSLSTPTNEIVAGFSPLGRPLTLPTTVDGNLNATVGGYQPDSLTGGLSNLTIDQAGYLWTLNYPAGYVEQMSVSNSSLETNFSTSNGAIVSNTGNPIAFDAGQNLWTFSDPAIEEFGPSTASGPGSLEVSVSLLNPPIVDNPNFPLIFDHSGNLWLADFPGSTGWDVLQFNGSGTQEIDAFPSGGGGIVAALSPALVADNAGYVYGCAETGDKTLDFFSASVTSAPYYQTIGPPTGSTGRGCGNGLLIDGMGNFFAVSNSSHASGKVIDEFAVTGMPSTPPTSLPVTPAPTLNLISPAGGYSGTSSSEPLVLNYDSTSGGLRFKGTSAGIDLSGNLWVINTDTGNNTAGNVLVEYVGIAAPVLTPASLATANGQLATRP